MAGHPSERALDADSPALDALDDPLQDRMFSPNPGQANVPSSLRRNQLTSKMRGGLGTLRPKASQWLMYPPMW